MNGWTSKLLWLQSRVLQCECPYKLLIMFLPTAVKLWGFLPGKMGKIIVEYNTHIIGSFRKNIVVQSNATNNVVFLDDLFDLYDFCPPGHPFLWVASGEKSLKSFKSSKYRFAI